MLLQVSPPPRTACGLLPMSVDWRVAFGPIVRVGWISSGLVFLASTVGQNSLLTLLSADIGSFKAAQAVDTDEMIADALLYGSAVGILHRIVLSALGKEGIDSLLGLTSSANMQSGKFPVTGEVL